ncbi:hypothetical protein [Pedobacter sp. Leaf170]|uniref:hypothetical protein n=1 Tax=Pedobacter sp. Leaf170 TaxID=2876558 RepID=UPI001E336FDA|nr:hypothetical protein [Pedobacter sp. Leaf170]
MSIKKITLISNSHLASNPRLVKEAEALSDAGFIVSVIFLQHIAQFEAYDEEIILKLDKVKFHPINFGSKDISSRYLNYKRLWRKLWLKNNFNRELSENLFFTEFKKIIKEHNADLYIGHTLQALPIVAWAAKNNGTKFAFDAEDYHRRETCDGIQNNLAEAIENKYLEDAEYISTASKFISDAYFKHFEFKKIITINNFFEYEDLNQPKVAKDTSPIKIVWFSQTIGLNRGLKEFIAKLALLNSDLFELHLRGTSDEFIRAQLLDEVSVSWKNKILFHDQCSPKKLNLWLRGFDIGLALENKIPINRDMCITNKIFQYFSAGLAIIATPTKGQNWVTDKAKDACIMLADNSDLGELKKWAENKEKLEYAKRASKNAAKEIFNWTIEKEKLIEVIKQIEIE